MQQRFGAVLYRRILPGAGTGSSNTARVEVREESRSAFCIVKTLCAFAMHGIRICPRRAAWCVATCPWILVAPAAPAGRRGVCAAPAFATANSRDGGMRTFLPSLRWISFSKFFSLWMRGYDAHNQTHGLQGKQPRR